MQQHLFIFSDLCCRRRAYLDLVVTDFSLRFRSNQIERVSNNIRKTNTKVVASTNQNRSKKRDEPIRIPSNYLKLVQRAGNNHAFKMRLVLVRDF